MPIYNEKGESIAPVSLTDEGENAQEVAAPAAEPDTAENAADPAEPSPESTGENVQEVAAPAVAEQKIKDAPQTAEENRHFAAERRAQKAKEDSEGAVRAAQDALISEMGLTGTDGKPIRTYAEYRAMQASTAETRRAEQLRRAGIDPDTLDSAIEGTPLVSAAKDAISAAQAARERAEEAESAATLDREIAKITAIDPQIKSFDDLYNMPEYEDFKALAGRFGFEKAYKMATAERREARLRQDAYNAAVSKSHLGATKKGSAAESYDISDADFNTYRELFPNATRKEAAAAYKKYRK